MNLWISLVAANLATAGFMTGLIWFVQVVHYPLFAAVGVDRFEAYERGHMRSTTWIVAPVMSVELLLAVSLVLLADSAWHRTSAWLALALLAIVWLSTALRQAPLHQRLAERFDTQLWQSLVRSNWLRAACWSVRSAGLLILLSPSHRGLPIE